MLIVGIDPGLDGGVALVGVGGTHGRPADEVSAVALPTRDHYSGKGREVDVGALLELITGRRWEGERAEPVHVFLEAVKGHPKRPGGVEVVKLSAPAMFNFGDGFGMLRGALEAFQRLGRDVVIQYPTPQTWQKVVFAGMNKGDAKKTALSFVSRRFPDLRLQKSARATNPHGGIVDALCVAEYGRRTLAVQ